MGGESMQVSDGRGGGEKKEREWAIALGFDLGQKRWTWVERNGLGRCNGRNGQWLFAVSLPNTLQFFGLHFFHKY